MMCADKISSYGHFIRRETRSSVISFYPRWNGLFQSIRGENVTKIDETMVLFVYMFDYQSSTSRSGSKP